MPSWLVALGLARDFPCIISLAALQFVCVCVCVRVCVCHCVRHSCFPCLLIALPRWCALWTPPLLSFNLDYDSDPDDASSDDDDDDGGGGGDDDDNDGKAAIKKENSSGKKKGSSNGCDL